MRHWAAPCGRERRGDEAGPGGGEGAGGQFLALRFQNSHGLPPFIGTSLVAESQDRRPVGATETRAAIVVLSTAGRIEDTAENIQPIAVVYSRNYLLKRPICILQ